MAPVNVLDRPLVGDALHKAQTSTLMCIGAEGGVILLTGSLNRLLRQIDRRAEGDNDARKEQRRRAVPKNVSANLIVRFHSYTSVLRREPSVAVDPAGRGSGGALGRRPTNLTRVHLAHF